MILQIFGAFTGPMLGVFFLGLFTTRVKSRVRTDDIKLISKKNGLFRVLLRHLFFHCYFKCSYWLDQ